MLFLSHPWFIRVKRIFTPLALVCLFYIAWHSREVLVLVFTNAHGRYLLLAMGAWALAQLMAPFCTLIILRTYDVHTTYLFAVSSYLDRLPARYLPGGIWQTVGRVTDFYAQGLKPVYLTTLFLLENLLAVGMGFAMGGGLLWYFKGLSDYWGILALAATIGSLFSLGVLPFVLNRKILKSVNPIAYFKYGCCLVIYIVAWSILATAFVCYLSAFPTVLGDIPRLEIAASYLFSWSVGFVAIFAPQGIGVFELVAGQLLTVPLSFGSLAVIIAGFRAIALLTDISLWIIFRAILIFSKQS